MNARRAGLLAALLALGGWAGAEILGIATQPGGTSGQLEYNGGVFKGVAGSQVSGSTVTVVEIRASTAAFGAAPSVSTFTNKGALNMAANADITLSGTGKLNGPVTGNVTGNAATATALAATPSAAQGGFVCRGVDAQGNCLQAAVDAAGVASSTNPVQSGALASHVTATGSSVHGATSSNSASQLVARDGSGNFSAGTITAALSGNATTATALQAAPSVAPSGYVSRGIDASGNAQLAAIDASPVNASTSPVQSGGVFTQLAAKAIDSAVVHLAGAENVSGEKTFTATGNTQYSLATSSGISVGGPVVAAGTGRFLNSGANVYSAILSSGAWVQAGGVKLPDGTVLVSTAGLGGGGAPGSIISSGTVSGGNVGVLAGTIPAGTTFYFNSASAQITRDITNNAAVISLLGPSFPPTRTVLTSGSGTYTPPAGVVQLKVHMVGGGGEGSGNSAGGNAGAATTWVASSPSSSIGANGGGGGNLTTQAGAGGTGGLGGSGVFSSSSVFRSPGQPGGFYSSTSDGGMGGASHLGGGGLGAITATAGTAAAANSGGGGGGYLNTAGGGGAEYVDLIINAPAASYTYTIGTGGSGVTNGAAGGSGIIIIDEYYQGQGYASSASSFTAIPTSTTGSGQLYTIAYATVTITSSGAPTFASFNGHLTNNTNGASAGWGVLVDGQYLSWENNKTGCQYGNGASGGFTMTGGAPCYIGTFSAGTHSFAWTMAATNTGVTSVGSADGGGGNDHPQFGVYENRNNPGSGDVSSNGNNNFSGSNTFSGPVNGVISISSAGYFSASTSAGTDPACQGSTFSVTMGAFPLEVKLTATGSTAGTALGRVRILIDGAYPDANITDHGIASFSGNAAGVTPITLPGFYQTPSALTAGTHHVCVTGNSGWTWACNLGACFMKISEAK